MHGARDLAIPRTGPRAFLGVTLLLCLGCDRPTSLGRPLTAPPAATHTRFSSKQFRPAATWPWNGPSECHDLTGVPGAYDSAMVYMITMVAPSAERMNSAVRLEFDRDRRLLLFQEDRNYVWYPGRPRPSSTSIQVGTGLGRSNWKRAGSATNYHWRGAGILTDASSANNGELTAEHLVGTAEEIWNHTALGVRDLYRLAVEKCGAGQRFTSTFETTSGSR